MSAKQLMKIFIPKRKMNARKGGRPNVGNAGVRQPGNLNGFPQNEFDWDTYW